MGGGGGDLEACFDHALVDGETTSVDEGAPNDILELADVPGPCLFRKVCEGVLVNGRRLGVKLQSVFGEEVVDECRDVFAALAERGELNDGGIQTEEEILAEGFVFDHLLKITVGGADDADVDGDLFLSSDTADGFFLQHAEEFDLRLPGEVADFIEEKGSAIGLLKTADTFADCSGEGSAFVAEEFAFDEVVRDGGTIDGDESPLGTLAMLVDGAGDEFLP